MATVHIGSGRNLQDCMRSSVPIKFVSQNFYPGDPRSGQLRDLLIISLWGNMERLLVSRKLNETTQFFQDNDHSLHLWLSECGWWSWFTGRSYEVTRSNPFFANKSWQNRDRDAQMTPNDLARQAALEDMHIDILGSWPDLDLTWGQLLKLIF